MSSRSKAFDFVGISKEIYNMKRESAQEVIAHALWYKKSALPLLGILDPPLTLDSETFLDIFDPTLEHPGDIFAV